MNPHLGRGTAQGARTQLSRDLVALWADEYGPALALLRRTLPAGLMRYLGQPRPRPAPAPRLREPPADALPAGPERALSPPPWVRPAARLAPRGWPHAAGEVTQKLQ